MRDADCNRGFCFEGDARAGCSSRLFGGEAKKQTGYGFQPVDDVSSQKVRGLTSGFPPSRE